MATRNSFDFPADFELVDDRRVITVPWGQWLSLVQGSVSSIRQSGTTANRPTSVLWIGRVFYDTTLGKPIWVHSVNPTVWHDAAGGVV